MRPHVKPGGYYTLESLSECSLSNSDSKKKWGRGWGIYKWQIVGSESLLWCYYAPIHCYRVLIAIVMGYEHSNNDLYYVVDNPPYLECWHLPLLLSDVLQPEDVHSGRPSTVMLCYPGVKEHFSDSIITAQQYIPTCYYANQYTMTVEDTSEW